MTTPAEQQHAAVEAFNATNPIGSPVLAWPGARDADPVATRTRAAAWVLGSHTAVAMVDGLPGAIALDHLELDPTRKPAVPDVEFLAPPCPMCAEDLECGGDGFECTSCEAHWDTSGGHGAWVNPEALRCAATRAGWFTDATEVVDCCLDQGHDQPHIPVDSRAPWHDTEMIALADGDGQAITHPPACNQCMASPAERDGMCRRCWHRNLQPREADSGA